MDSSLNFQTNDHSQSFLTDSQNFNDTSEINKEKKFKKRVLNFDFNANTYIDENGVDKTDGLNNNDGTNRNKSKSVLTNVFDEEVDDDQIKEYQNKATNLMRKISINNENSQNDGQIKQDNSRRMSCYQLNDRVEYNRRNLTSKTLEKLQNIFLKRRNFFILDKKTFRSPDHLNKTEFVELLSNCLIYVDEEDIIKLFKKLDTHNTGMVTWSEFCGYLMSYFNQKAFSESLKILPFNNAPKMKHSPHNRLEVTAKILSINNPLKFINVSRTGAIGIWNRDLTLHKRFRIDPSIHDQPLFLPKTTNSKYKTWVTDAITLSNVHKLVISTSARELRFFSISHEHCIEEFVIYGLENVPTCLDYWFDNTLNSNQSMLFIGEENGNIEILDFRDAANSLYDPVYRAIKGVTKIYWAELKNHSSFVNRLSYNSIHTEAIRKLKYIRASNTIISASSDSKSSIVICDLECKRKPYTFQLNKGCLCFDYSKKLSLLVTGSSDSCVRLWDLYVTDNPITSLNDHKTMVVDVKIHEHFDYLYSFSSDGALYVWDLIDTIVIQKLNLNFPSIINNRCPEYGEFPLHLYFDTENPQSGLLLIACDDYLASLKIGSASKASFPRIVSHTSPITAMIYSSLLRQVITGSDDSSLSYWNLDNGQQILSVKNAHGNEEITSMELDKTQRRLFTGARDGTIKVWNVVNGCNIQNYLRYNDTEVTGIVYVNNRKMVLSVGWSRKIVTYFDVTYQENFIVKPGSFSHNKMHHEDDILCADSCGNMLATASYDGEIYIWNTDNETLITCLQKAPKINHLPPVDTLLFLKHRVSKYGLNVGLLVSSQNGVLSFFTLYSNQKCLSSFYSSDFPNESVLSLCTDEENTILVAGDSNGFIYIWDIENYALKAEVSNEKPRRMDGWKCHQTSIISCQFVDSSTSSYAVDLIITASSDFACKLWTINGRLIGTFGQKAQWNIRNEKTYADYNPFSFKSENGERINLLPMIDAVNTLKKIVHKNRVNRDRNELPEDDNTKDFELNNKRSQSRMLQNQTKTPRYDYLSSIKYFKFEKEIITSNDHNDLKNLKLDPIETDRNERRKIHQEIDENLVLRLPNICSPYVSLQIPKFEYRPKVILPTDFGFKIPTQVIGSSSIHLE